MEQVLGKRSDPYLFQAFLAQWETILDRRVRQAVSSISSVPGVCGLLLAGSAGRGEQWPLSDIDLLPIFGNGHVETAQRQIAARCEVLLDEWASEGWWTGLDIGKLFFRADEVEMVLQRQIDTALVLEGDRWYYSVDKGFGSLSVYDPLGLGSALAAWLTEQRFSPHVVQLRLNRNRREFQSAKRTFHAAAAEENLLECTRAVQHMVKWLRASLLEGWGERDNSLGRLGTRFERIARERGQDNLAIGLNWAADLDDSSVQQRMALAPEWVWERHDRSWRSRQHIGEPLTQLQDARDVLRVCSDYEMRTLTGPPFSTWLAIPSHPGALQEKVEWLDTTARRVFLENA